MISVAFDARVTEAGDSFQTLPWMWSEAAGGFHDQMQALYPQNPKRRATCTGGRGSSSGRRGVGRNYLQWTINGIAGSGSTSLLLNVASRVNSGLPTIVVLYAAVNDAVALVGSDPTATIHSNYQGIFDAILAVNPTAQIAVFGTLAFGEKHDGTHFTGNSPDYDTSIADVDTAIASICASNGVTFIRQRDWLLALEITHNGGNLTSYYLDQGLHPFDFAPSGAPLGIKIEMANHAMTNFQAAP